jgi:hypothetical protein
MYLCIYVYLCYVYTTDGVMTKALLIHSGTGMSLYHGGMCVCVYVCVCMCVCVYVCVYMTKALLVHSGSGMSLYHGGMCVCMYVCVYVCAMCYVLCASGCPFPNPTYPTPLSCP